MEEKIALKKEKYEYKEKYRVRSVLLRNLVLRVKSI